MIKELTPEEVEYKFITSNEKKEYLDDFPQYKDIYEKIDKMLSINKSGYNLYIIDDFSKEKLANIVAYIKAKYSNKNISEDICYVTGIDGKTPRCICAGSGKGNLLKDTVEDIKNFYTESIYNFYNNNKNKEIEGIVNKIKEEKNELVEKLIKDAHREGFDIKSTQVGFNFIPIKDGELMSEEEYDMLGVVDKQEMLDKMEELRVKAKDILEKIKILQNSEMRKLKEKLQLYFEKDLEVQKNKFMDKFKEDENIREYLFEIYANIEEGVTEIYSMSYDDDEEGIIQLISEIYVNVIVDNSGNEDARVIYEDDPSISNLIGSIEYENRNGNYYTDVSLIKAGTLMKANNGCVIIRMNNLSAYPLSYYYLKKALLNESISFDYNRGYLELVSLNGLKPEPVSIKVKVIIIGDYSNFNMLYNYDEDFKKAFKMKAEFKPYIEITGKNNNILNSFIKRYSDKNNINQLSSKAVKEIAKFMSRKAESRTKLSFDYNELDRLIMLSNYSAINRNRSIIEQEDIINSAYLQDEIENELIKMYEDKKILFSVKGDKIGQINGLSVIDTGYLSFGKPIRITCTAYKGDGRIIDVHKESNLSGKVHSKSVNILNGCINNIFESYGRLNVDFHICFEQLYGKLEGDSASVAEIICMISSLSKIPIKQSIAVTGSINQFGEVQAIGGVNEKIEGFYKVCKVLDNIEEKGVLIPESNKSDIILIQEVENAIKEKKFHIYTMRDLNDALDVLMGNDKLTSKDIIEAAKAENIKYGIKK